MSSAGNKDACKNGESRSGSCQQLMSLISDVSSNMWRIRPSPAHRTPTRAAGPRAVKSATLGYQGKLLRSSNCILKKRRSASCCDVHTWSKRSPVLASCSMSVLAGCRLIWWGRESLARIVRLRGKRLWRGVAQNVDPRSATAIARSCLLLLLLRFQQTGTDRWRASSQGPRCIDTINAA